jgi:hypothetical protein
MKAYRVWVTFADGLEGFASAAYEKRERAITICSEQAAKNPDYSRLHPTRRLMAFDVREEDVPWTYKPTHGESIYVTGVIMGDDEEFTQVGV